MFSSLPSHFSRPRFPNRHCVNMALSAGGSDNAGEYMTHGSLVPATSYKQNDQKDNDNADDQNNDDNKIVDLVAATP